MLLLSTHNICFHGENKKNIYGGSSSDLELCWSGTLEVIYMIARPEMDFQVVSLLSGFQNMCFISMLYNKMSEKCRIGFSKKKYGMFS